MPNTANRTYPYPALTDPANGPLAFQQLAQAVDTDVAKILTAAPMAFQVGTASASMGGAAYATGTVNFPKAFTAPPIVFLNLSTGGTNKLIASVNSGASQSATSFAWAIRTGDGTTSTATPQILWIAFGQLA